MSTPVNVLVVDDEEDMQWLFRQRFRREVRAGRYAFHFAFSGEKALEYLYHEDRTGIVLVLSDINMPGMTGLELLQHIKAEFDDLPVHMITAYGSQDTYQKAIEYGADGYLTKPLDFTQLKQTLTDLEA
ncbi:MAG: response regulator [Rhodothermales bacterium]